MRESRIPAVKLRFISQPLLSFALLGVFASIDAGEANCPEPAPGTPKDSPPASVTLPRLMSRSPAVFPPELQKQKISGYVMIQGTVDIDGKVMDRTQVACSVQKKGKPVEEGDEKERICGLFFAAGSKAFAQYRYEPATQGGKAVCVYENARFSLTYK